MITVANYSQQKPNRATLTDAEQAGYDLIEAGGLELYGQDNDIIEAIDLYLVELNHKAKPVAAKAKMTFNRIPLKKNDRVRVRHYGESSRDGFVLNEKGPHGPDFVVVQFDEGSPKTREVSALENGALSLISTPADKNRKGGPMDEWLDENRAAIEYANEQSKKAARKARKPSHSLPKGRKPGKLNPSFRLKGDASKPVGLELDCVLEEEDCAVLATVNGERLRFFFDGYDEVVAVSGESDPQDWNNAPVVGKNKLATKRAEMYGAVVSAFRTKALLKVADNSKMRSERIKQNRTTGEQRKWKERKAAAAAILGPKLLSQLAAADMGMLKQSAASGLHTKPKAEAYRTVIEARKQGDVEWMEKPSKPARKARKPSHSLPKGRKPGPLHQGFTFKTGDRVVNAAGEAGVIYDFFRIVRAKGGTTPAYVVDFESGKRDNIPQNELQPAPAKAPQKARKPSHSLPKGRKPGKLKKATPAPAPAPAAKRNEKAAKAPAKAKTPRTKKDKPTDTRKEVSHFGPDLLLIRSFTALTKKGEKPITVGQVRNLNNRVQKAIVSRKVRKTSAHADVLRDIAEVLPRAVEMMAAGNVGTVDKLNFDQTLVAKALTAATASKVSNAVGLLSRFINMQGTKPETKAVAPLLKALEKEHADHPKGDYAAPVGLAVAMLKDWQPGRAVKLTTQQLNGLNGLPGLGCACQEHLKGPKKARR